MAQPRMKAPERAKKKAPQAGVRKGAGGSARAEATARTEVRADRDDEGGLVDVDPDEIVGTFDDSPELLAESDPVDEVIASVRSAARQSELAAGDVDALVTDADGEEAVGGTEPTPEQNDVDALGRALGVTYELDEPLHTTEKIEKRDAFRWELNPASSEDFAERQKPDPIPPAKPARRARRSR